jgi:hypothetical protein
MFIGGGPGFLAKGFAGLCLVMPASGFAGQACFDLHDNTHLSFQVIQQAPPPRAETAPSYIYYPLTGAASMQLGSVLAASPGYATYYFQWANRSNAVLTNPQGRIVVRKTNLQPSLAGGRKQRTAFTSIARADACTLAQTASVLGLPQRARAFAAAASIHLVSEEEQADTAPLGPVDSCVLAKGSLPQGRSGVLLDFEVQDGRTPRKTTHFLESWARLVHGAGRPAILLLNPMDAPTQAYSGVSAANAHRLVSLFDLTTILLWSKNAKHSVPLSYAAQKAMIAAGGRFDGSRVLIDFELANTTLADAQFVRRAILADHLAGVLFWRNQARQGGNCQSDVNRKIAVIAMGENPAGVDGRGGQPQ